MAKIELNIPDGLDRICTWPVLLYRKLKYGYPYRRIYLGEDLWTIVDPQDFYKFGRFNWHFEGHDGKFYAVSCQRVGLYEVKKVRLHREILNAPKDRCVDHRNGNSLDNRNANIRLATRSQNMQNMRRRRNKSDTSSQFVGVYFDKNRNLWAYRLRANGKVVASGRFHTEIEAARARDRAALKYHGEFARLNFPREDYIDEFPLTTSK